MKKILKASILALSISFPSYVGATDSTDRDSRCSSQVKSRQVMKEDLISFLQDNAHLYHQVATEKYRKSVLEVRQEIANLRQRQESLDNQANDIESIKQCIRDTEEKIAIRQTIKEKYNKYKEDDDKIIKVLTEEKSSFHRRIEECQNNRSPQSLIDHFKSGLKETERFLDNLKESEDFLNNTLSIQKDLLRKLEKERGFASDAKALLEEKRFNLRELCEQHIKGPTGMEIFPITFPKVILQSMRLPENHLDFIDEENLHRLFSRSLEFPYFEVKTGEDIKEAYVSQAKILSGNFEKRLWEDVYTLALSASALSASSLKGINLNESYLNFSQDDRDCEIRGLVREERILPLDMRFSNDVDLLGKLLKTYGHQDATTLNLTPLLEYVLAKTSYGFLGLCVESLATTVPTSWRVSAEIGEHIYFKKSVKTSQDLSKHIIKTMYSIISRHINKIVLDKIIEHINRPTNIGTRVRPYD